MSSFPYIKLSNVFNPDDFLAESDSITLQTADARYIQIGSFGVLSALNCAGNGDFGSLSIMGSPIELGFISGVTEGVAQASKALVLDSMLDNSGMNQLTLNNLVITSPNDYTHDPCALVCSGGLDITGNSRFLGSLSISNGITGTLQTAAQANITSVGTLTSITTSGSLTMSGITISSSEIGVLDAVTAGTAVASKAVVLDSSKNIATINSLTATSITGTLQTAAQANITSVGTLTSLTLSGAISGATTIGASGVVSLTNTTLSTSASTGGLVLSGGLGIAKNITIGGTNFSASSWTTSGIQLKALATTYTNSSTASFGIAASAVINSFAQSTIAATNSLVVTTKAATVYIDNAPTAGTNMTLTNAYSLWIGGGQVNIDTAISSTSQITGSIVSGGGMGLGGTLSADSTYLISGSTIGTALVNQTAWTTTQGNNSSFLDGSFSILADFYGTGGVRCALQCHNGSSATSTNAAFFGTLTNNDLKLGTNDSTKMIILGGTNAGRVGIGTTSPSAQLDISGSVSTTIDAGGSGYGQGSKTAYTTNLGPLASQAITLRTSNSILITSGSFFTTSDIRLKKDITDLDDKLADRVLELNPIQYRMKSESNITPRTIGISAQQALELGLSEIVNFISEPGLEATGNFDLKDIAFSVDYSKLSVLLLLALKKANARIATLESARARKSEESQTPGLSAQSVSSVNADKYFG